MTRSKDNSKDPLKETFFSIVNCEIYVWEALESALRESGVPITVGRLIPLYYLADGPLRLQELTERMHAKPSAASRLAERMVSDGLIEKRRDACDGRAVLLHITERGQRIEEAGWEVIEQGITKIFDDLCETEMQELQSLLCRLMPPDARTVA